MNKKIILCALLVFFSGADLTFGKVKKRNHVKKIQPQEEVCDEIDNFDFLYVNGDENLDYDVAKINNIMDEAMSHLGARYRSGSKGPNAFDCSGFTSYVFGRNNMQIGVPAATSMLAICLSAAVRCSVVTWCSSPAQAPAVA